MKIDALDLYPELSDLREELNRLTEKLNNESFDPLAPSNTQFDYTAAFNKAHKAYVELVAGHYYKIMADANKIVEALEKEDCEESRAHDEELIEVVTSIRETFLKSKDEKKQKTAAGIKRFTDELREKLDHEFEFAFDFILLCLEMQNCALLEFDLPREDLLSLVENKAAEWYELPDNWDYEEEFSVIARKEDAIGLAINSGLPTHVIANQVLKVDYPLDYINRTVWDYIADADPNGQLTFLPNGEGAFGIFNMAKKNSGKVANVFYSINFAGLDSDAKITKKLTNFDKRVMIAVAALFNAGNTVISINQIHKTMGNADNANSRQKQNIKDSVIKMNAAQILLSNKYKEAPNPETSTYPNVPEFEYINTLLPMKLCAAYVNGVLTQDAIQIYDEPPLVTFAKSRKQFTTIPPELLASNIPKTEQNLAIEDYLIERIFKMRRDSKNKHKKPITKILFSTINENCNRRTKDRKKATPKKVYEYLDYYKSLESFKLFSDYTKEPDGVNIKL